MRFLWLIPLLIALTITSLYNYTGRFDTPPKTKTFLDRQGHVIGTLNPAFNGFQIWTPLNKIPQQIIDKITRAEDRFFFWHAGINPISIVKAAIQNIDRGKIQRGGSTITQQLAKTLIQEKEEKILSRTWYNKFRETFLAFGLELKHSKSWILERYLNSIYFGRRNYGLTAASITYFGKRLEELNSEEIDFLVARPKAPNRISNALSLDPSLHPLPSREGGREAHNQFKDFTGRHFIEWAAYQTPLSPVVETTLDLKLQRKLEELIPTLLTVRIREDPLLTAAAIIIDVTSGDILAMVGSRNYFDDLIKGQFNAATALRQPGSTLKPFTYFAAFSKGMGASTLVQDEPISFFAAAAKRPDAYIPQNFDRRYHGNVTIRLALANSYNVPAVITLNEIGLSYYHDLLRKFGFTTLTKPPNHYGLSVTLGSGEVTLLELTTAYAALARGGSYLPYRWLKNQERKKPQPVLPHAEQYAAEVTNILKDWEARLKGFGLNENLIVEGHEVAVKTGTSHNHRDNWTVGYTPTLAIGVWVGHADGSALYGTTGSSGAAPLWHAVMEHLLRGDKKELFQFPPYQVALAQEVFPDWSWEDEEKAPGWRLNSPLPHSRYRVHPYLPKEHQQILAEVIVTDEEIDSLRWYLDGKFFTETEVHPFEKTKVWISPDPGNHILRLVGPNGQKQTIPFYILETST